MKKYCIVNGDDFGASLGINRGILEAHRRGILTSTSFMVGMPGAEDAAHSSREAPQLGVGLHVVLTNEDCTPLVDFDSPEMCRNEIARQWKRFIDLIGEPPTHLDAHHNIYRDARLTPLFVEWAAMHTVPLRENSEANYFPDFYGQWDGETHLEQISVENLCRMLREEIAPGLTEIGCHPGYPDKDFTSSYAIERETELRTLCSPTVRETISDLGISLINYKALGTIFALPREGTLT